MRKRSRIVGWVAIAWTAVAGAAAATPLTYQYTAVASEDVIAIGGGGVVQFLAPAGAAITGTFVLDDAAVDLKDSDPTIGEYSIPGSPDAFTLTFGGITMTGSELRVSVLDNDPDYGDVVALAPLDTVWSDPTFFAVFPGISLEDVTGQTLSSDALPTDAAVLASFPSIILDTDLDRVAPRFREGVLYVDLTAEVTDLRRAPAEAPAVPEPTAACTFAAGLGIILVALRRWRR